METDSNMARRKTVCNHRTLMGKDLFDIASRTECDHLVSGVKNIVVGGSGDFLGTEIKFAASFQKGFPCSLWDYTRVLLLV